MDKYNFELDIEVDSSNSVILRNIKPNSKILEFGCDSSLTDMVERCGLSVVNKIDLLNAVENTEFGNKYEDVDIGEFLRLREDGEVY